MSTDETLQPDTPLRQAVLEVEEHVGAEGWDQPARMYALVPTADLVASEPALAEQLGVDAAESPMGALTPVEQDEMPETALEDLLQSIEWPEQVAGCAVVVERVMLPPEAEEGLPEDPGEAAAAAAAHPDRQEVRLAVGVLRDGSTHCAVRPRSGGGEDVLEGPDLVPALVTLLWQTLTD